MKKFSLILLFLSACGGSGNVRIDATPIFTQHNALTSDEKTITRFELSLSADDVKEQVLATLTPEDPVFEAVVSSGIQRHFAVTGFHGETSIIYWGETIVDLAARSTIDLTISIYPAGGFTGTLNILDGTTLPRDFKVNLTLKDTPPEGLSSGYTLVFNNNNFKRALPVGDYTLSAEFKIKNVTYTFLQQDKIITIEQGKTLNLDLQIVPPNYCNAALGITPDADKDGDNCNIDCNDGDATLNFKDVDQDTYASCEGDCNDADATVGPFDYDGDGFKGCGDDCDDTRTTGKLCFVNCTTFYQDADGDGSGNPSVSVEGCEKPAGYVNDNTDCNDAKQFCAKSCVDADKDNYCADTDCNDASSSCTTSCVDTDNDGVTDCQDPCIDSDSDGFGVAQSISCTTNGSTACTLGKTCTTTDCLENASSCTNNCSIDSDKDGRPDCLDWCTDKDQDGYGTDNTTFLTNSCRYDKSTSCYQAYNVNPPTQMGTKCLGSDCNDNSAAITPLATETAGNNIDENCDGRFACYVDYDCDGYGSYKKSVTLSGTACSSSAANNVSTTDNSLRVNCLSLSNTDCNDSSACTTSSGCTVNTSAPCCNSSMGAAQCYTPSATDADGDGATGCDDGYPDATSGDKRPYELPDSLTFLWKRCNDSAIITNYSVYLNNVQVGAFTSSSYPCSTGETKAFTITGTFYSANWSSTVANKLSIKIDNSNSTEKIFWFKGTFNYTSPSSASLNKCLYDTNLDTDNANACSSTTTSCLNFCSTTKTLEFIVPHPDLYNSCP